MRLRWPRGWAALVAAVAIAASALPSPTRAADHETQYSLHNGTIVGPAAEQAGVTILIDQKNGRTWMLIQGESVQWREIPFAPDEPAHQP